MLAAHAGDTAIIEQNTEGLRAALRIALYNALPPASIEITSRAQAVMRLGCTESR